VDTQLRAYGLTLSQRDVLLALYEEGPLSQGALRELLGLEQSSVSRLVDGLKRKGLVKVNLGADDRRVRTASLTDEGRQLLLRTPGSSALAGSAMTEGLSAEEKSELIRFLEICTDNLNGRPTSRPAGRGDST
jgi:MarR family transcriptional regulator for hemolysin